MQCFCVFFLGFAARLLFLFALCALVIVTAALPSVMLLGLRRRGGQRVVPENLIVLPNGQVLAVLGRVDVDPLTWGGAAKSAAAA